MEKKKTFKKWKKQTSSSTKKDDTFLQSIIDAVKTIELNQWEHFAKDFKFGRPYNPIRDTYYSPMNAFRLTIDCLIRGYSNFNFATLKNINESGGRIKKGSKAMFIDYTTFFYKHKETHEKIDFEQYNQLSKEEKEDYYFKRIYKVHAVYNFEQIEDISICDFSKCTLEESEELTQDFEVENSIEDFVNKLKENKGLNLKFSFSKEAFYAPKLDFIQIPKLEIFKSKEMYYSTLLHELIHWTGHESRLSRFSLTEPNSKEKYSFEELVAEIGALFLCNQFGIFENFINSIVYLKGWIKSTELIKNSTDEDKEINKDLVLRQAFAKSNEAIKFLNK